MEPLVVTQGDNLCFLFLQPRARVVLILLTKTKLDKPCEDPVAVVEMAEELQLEMQSLVFKGKRESLVKVAEFFNVEHEE